MPLPPRLRKNRKPLFALLCVLLAGAAAAGCGEGAGDSHEPAGTPAAAEGEWAWLQKAHQALQGKRQQLAELEAGAGAPGAARDSAQQATALRAEVDRLTAQLGLRLVAFINSRPPVDDQPLSAVQRAALRLKSDEDILLARAYVERGGDYRRAIEIYEAALAVDPRHPRLRDELAAARRLRYMTRDRFDQVKEGMKGEEVRRLLGAPNLHNVRAYPDREVEAWFYPKDGSGAAAAVWFRTPDKAGAVEGTVYEADFDAVQPPAPTSPPAPVPGAPGAPLAPSPAPAGAAPRPAAPPAR